jgi:AcrR family transcriptional regulator
MAHTRASAREGAEARERILRAAHAQFAARGFRGATLDAIATDARMSRAGVLHHFDSKQALLLALLDARDEELGLLSSPVSQWRHDSATGLLASMRTTIHEVLAGRDLVRLAHTLTAEAAEPDHPAHDWLVQRSRRLRAMMAAAFEASFARGELAPEADSRTLAALCLATVEGLEAQWLADPDEVDLAQGVALLESLIRSALAPDR